MKPYLLLISFAGVQDFIRLTRKTADLRFASELLSDLAITAATSLKNKGANILIPGTISDNNFQAGGHYGVSNVIVCRYSEVNGHLLEPKELFEVAQTAVRKKLYEILNQLFDAAKNSVGKDLADIEKSLKKAIDDGDFPKILACWSGCDSGNDYKLTPWEQLMHTMAAAKKIPSVAPVAKSTNSGNHPISDISGRDYSVTNELTPKACLPLGLIEHEQLDALEFFKRLGGRFGAHSERFAPLSRIAIEPWVQDVKKKYSAKFDTLNNKYKKVFNKQSGNLVNKVKIGQYKDFPWDGALLFGDSIKIAAAEANGDRDSNLIKALGGLETTLQEMTQLPNVTKPKPYFAIIRSDIDELGKTITNKANKDFEELINFSKSLAKFTGSCCKIVEEHNGQWLYAGGDDILAFAPVSTAIKIANKIRVATPDEESISTAITIGHIKSPLSNLLAASEQAMNQAKVFRSKKALHIEILTRSGAPFVWTGGDRFQFKNESPEKFVSELVKLFNNKSLPMGLPYRIAELHKTHPLLQLISNQPNSNETKLIENLLTKSLGEESSKELTTRMHLIIAGLKIGSSDLMLARHFARLGAPYA